MAGAQRRIKAQAELDRDLALMTAYYSGLLAQANFSKVPELKTFNGWHRSMTVPREAQRASNAEIVNWFRARAASPAQETPE